MALLMKMQDEDIARDIIRNRKRLGLDHHDEVWEGMYVMPSMPNNDHQRIVADLSDIFTVTVKQSGLGYHVPGANVSDRQENWQHNFRVPDILVFLRGSLAVDCGTHFMGALDFLVEIESPGDDTEEKIPFYAEIGVRELLILHRDRRTVRLLRHEGNELVEVQPTTLEGKMWLVSAVLPLAFRRRTIKGAARNEVRRTDDGDGAWVI